MRVPVCPESYAARARSQPFYPALRRGRQSAKTTHRPGRGCSRSGDKLCAKSVESHGPPGQLGVQGGTGMSGSRLTTLDASFLEVESASAHMHVGWAARFAPPAGGRRPNSATCATTWPGEWAARRATARSSPRAAEMHEPGVGGRHRLRRRPPRPPQPRARPRPAGRPGDVRAARPRPPAVGALDRRRSRRRRHRRRSARPITAMVDGLAAVELATLLAGPHARASAARARRLAARATTPDGVTLDEGRAHGPGRRGARPRAGCRSS